MSFKFDENGWAHISPLGEFEHSGAGVVQVIDEEAAKAIVEDFKAKASAANFPGLLVDFDHFSMDTDKPSEAAGWITELRQDAQGIWAKVRWSNKGLEAVEGGAYRLVSPVFPKASLCEDLGGGRIRPRALTGVALTNEPNIKGAKPLTNRAEGEETPNRWSDAARAAALIVRRARAAARKASKETSGVQYWAYRGPHAPGTEEKPEGEEKPAEEPKKKIAASSIRTNRLGSKFVSFTDEDGNQRYLREGESEDGYEATAIDDQTGEASIKTPSGETVQVKTDDIPKKKEVPAAVPPGKARVPPAKLPPAKVDPNKKLTGLQKWRLGEIERERKNEARKAAAKEKLKQIRDDLAAKRFKFNTKQDDPAAKSNGGVGKSFLGKAVVPKTRYYIDGAWYDGSGKFISRNKPATGLSNRSGGEEKRYKWVLGETKTGTHCPDCEARAGKVKTIAEWKAMGKPPCKCKCRLVPILKD
jgi:hypothetical protein